MGIMRVIKEEGWKIALSKRMFGVLCAVAFVCLLSPVYFGANGEEYNGIQLLFYGKKELLLSDMNLCRQVLYHGGGIFLYLFSAIIISFLLSETLALESQTGFRRYQVMRVSRRQFLLGRYFLSGGISGLVMCAGHMLYCLLVRVRFYDISAYGMTTMDLPPNIYSPETGLVGPLLIMFGGIFLYGFFIGCFVCFCSCFIRNQYLLLAVPFMILYLLEILMHMEKFVSMEGRGLGQWAFFLSPQTLLVGCEKGNLQYDIFYGIVMLILGIVYTEVERGKMDFGV